MEAPAQTPEEWKLEDIDKEAADSLISYSEGGMDLVQLHLERVRAGLTPDIIDSLMDRDPGKSHLPDSVDVFFTYREGEGDLHYEMHLEGYPGRGFTGIVRYSLPFVGSKLVLEGEIPKESETIEKLAHQHRIVNNVYSGSQARGNLR